MENPEIWFNKRERFVKANEPAKSLVGDREISDLNDLVEGIVSLRLFSEEEMKVPFKTKNGTQLSRIRVEDKDEMKKVIIPIEKNKWVTDYLSNIEIDELKLEEAKFDKKRDALEKIREVEESLKESTDFDAERTLIFNFGTTNEFNSFSDEIKDKDNVELEDTDQMDNQILAIVKITSPTRSWV